MGIFAETTITMQIYYLNTFDAKDVVDLIVPTDTGYSRSQFSACNNKFLQLTTITN